MNFIILLFITLSFLANPISAAEIHAVIVGNTGSDVGLYAAEKSIDQIQREVKRIAAFNDFSLNIAVFEGFNTRIDLLMNYLENLKVSKDDVVIFFIVTHGTRTHVKNNSLPDLIFPFENPNSRDRIDFNEINQLLKKKNARLLLSIAEACNTYEEPEKETAIFMNENLGEPIRQVSYPKNSPELQFISQRNPSLQKLYRGLFTDTNGMILISSASPGESSLGGLFVHQLMQSIYDADDKVPGPENWKAILKSTSKQIKTEVQKHTQGQKKQTIQCEIKTS